MTRADEETLRIMRKVGDLAILAARAGKTKADADFKKYSEAWDRLEAEVNSLVCRAQLTEGVGGEFHQD